MVKKQAYCPTVLLSKYLREDASVQEKVSDGFGSVGEFG